MGSVGGWIVRPGLWWEVVVAEGKPERSDGWTGWGARPTAVPSGSLEGALSGERAGIS